ncbi:MAG TPA: HEAT repeat domain-containing protein [Gemmatimonadales bacterium]|nr:HEAT repeat domain-containing protein [Gemmatimonadales bacterium]
MTAGPQSPPSDTDVRAIEELVRALLKGQRALQMYLPNNPVYQRAVEQVADGFRPVWGVTGRLVLDIQEEEVLWDGVVVYRQSARNEGFAWQLYKDGLRRLTFLPGAESEEVVRFLQVVNRARLLPADASDDLLTLLWEQEFVLISYSFVEAGGDGVEFVHDSAEREAEPMPDAAREEVGRARAPEQGMPLPAGVVQMADFDATPYFLDEPEIRLIRNDLDEEYRRDIRQAAIDALLDILESQRDPVVRREAVSLLDDILPAQLSAGGFRAVARILRELRVISARAQDLDEELHRAVLSFEERLSRPDILEQLFRVLEDSATRPSEEDLGEVMRELKPAALPTVLVHLGGTLPAPVRQVLEASVSSIARTQPQAIAAILDNGPAEAVAPAITVAARIGLSQLSPVIIQHLQTGSDAVRLAAVRALGEFATPNSIAAVEGALEDGERTVRQAALATLLERGGSGGVLRRLERLLFDGIDHGWERTERRSLFEAYGELAGDNAVPRLRELLEPRGVFRRREPAEVRACALFALAKVRTFDARLVVDGYTQDKEAVVRSTANAVLRDWVT